MVVHSNEGAVNKFLVDDKGTLLLAVFGVGMSHTNDPTRALKTGLESITKVASSSSSSSLFALKLKTGLESITKLKTLGFHAQCGVTTGNVFAGAPLSLSFSLAHTHTPNTRARTCIHARAKRPVCRRMCTHRSSASWSL